MINVRNKKSMNYMGLPLILIMAVIFSSCSALVYKIRGPKYEGEFRQECYLPVLNDQYYYIHYDRSENFNDSIRIVGNDTISVTRSYSKHTYIFLKYDSDGVARIREIGRSTPLGVIPTKSEIDQLPVLNQRFYVIKDSLIKYEVYHDSYNGYNLHKTRIYPDSLVDWQVGISKSYLKTYNRWKN